MSLLGALGDASGNSVHLLCHVCPEQESEPALLNAKQNLHVLLGTMSLRHRSKSFTRPEFLLKVLKENILWTGTLQIN